MTYFKLLTAEGRLWVTWSSLVSFHTMSDLSRDEDRIMSGNLGLVAIWVTQPLWPSKVPRNVNVSAMFHRFFSINFQKTGWRSTDLRTFVAGKERAFEICDCSHRQTTELLSILVVL